MLTVLKTDYDGYKDDHVHLFRDWPQFVDYLVKKYSLAEREVDYILPNKVCDYVDLWPRRKDGTYYVLRGSRSMETPHGAKSFVICDYTDHQEM